MNDYKTYIRISIFLCGLSLVALLLAHLALTDIYHGGEPLLTEWKAVQIAFFITACCISFGLYTLIRLSGHLVDKQAGEG